MNLLNDLGFEMKQEEHERLCSETFGKPFAEVHAYLDQYYPMFRNNNHRLLLHHQQGIELVVERFGEEARGPAEQHIELDWGFVPTSCVELEKYFFPLSNEEEALLKRELHKLYENQLFL